jgi:hypothetical protein
MAHSLFGVCHGGICELDPRSVGRWNLSAEFPAHAP